MSINDQLGAQLRYQTTDLSRSDFLNYHHRNKTLVAHGPSGPLGQWSSSVQYDRLFHRK